SPPYSSAAPRDPPSFPTRRSSDLQMQMQMDMMQRIMLWFMPLIILAGGFLWQVGLALYMFTNGLWTFVQQRVLFGIMDKEEEEERQAKLEARRTSAPKPGAKPQNNKKRKK